MKEARDAGDSLRALYEYLTQTQVFERLTENQEALMSRNMPAEAMQIRQLWEAFMQLFSQAHALLGSERVSPRQLASWL